MSAFTTAPVTTEKRPERGARQSDTIGAVYTRALNICIAAASASANTGALTAKLPAGTCVLAAYLKSDVTNTNSMTVELKATTSPNAVFVAATAPVATGWTPAVVTTAGVGLLGLDDTITITLGVGASPATAINVSVLLVCAEIGITASTYSTFTG